MCERPENRALIMGERYTILEVLNPKIARLSRASAPHSRWPNFTFFNFPGTVLPFFYFSVVRKVPEKPVLFLPHPTTCAFLKRESYSVTFYGDEYFHDIL
jgi:hypothetical protein